LAFAWARSLEVKIENFNQMLEEIQRERGIHKEALLDAIRMSLLSAAKKIIKGEDENLEAIISDEGEVKIILKKEGQEQDVTPKDFGRLAAQTAKQVIIQRIREAEKEEVLEEFTKKVGELITGTVQRREFGGYLINIGRLETVLPVSEQIPGEILRDRDRVKLFLVETKKGTKGPMVIVSRAHPGFVKKLFEMEVPEIKDGILEIKGLAREPGKRTKIAVLSHDKNVGAVGTCVGHLGARIQNIVRELGPERVDIIEWSDDPKTFIAHALSPAKVSKIELNPEDNSAKVHVSERDLSLAIGKEGQNVRLAVKLTGWKLDILSEEGAKKSAAAPVEIAPPDKVRVHELAKELGITSTALIEKLKASGLAVKAANSVVPDDAVKSLRNDQSPKP
jgi:N utilization substance protein A